MEFSQLKKKESEVLHHVFSEGDPFGSILQHSTAYTSMVCGLTGSLLEIQSHGSDAL